ncbi:NFAT activation molecule 1 [Pogoniulus pusillus]|uniref:NFAT activation molecule 1 n=1 Tax=Pogoniulus pusillus TaxID=488313 RepID=UPI0030B93AB9
MTRIHLPRKHKKATAAAAYRTAASGDLARPQPQGRGRRRAAARAGPVGERGRRRRRHLVGEGAGWRVTAAAPQTSPRRRGSRCCGRGGFTALRGGKRYRSCTNSSAVVPGGTPLVPACHAGGGTVDVEQKPPIQVALLKEGISIPCEVIFPYMPKYTKFSIFYFWINSLGQTTYIHNRSENVPIPSGKENKTVTLSYNHRVVPLENTSSGTYYCMVKWNDFQKVGKGVFVLARGTGYIDTSYKWEVLITLTVLLAALSITATALLLWKRKVLCLRKNQPSILRQKVETQPPSASPPSPPLPVYDCLDLQQVEVYSILENNTNHTSPRKSPLGKTPKKQAALEESSDTLYENI